LDLSNILLAFALTIFAGLSTGIGGAIAFFAKKTNTRFLSVALGFSAGVMIYLSFMEILPKALESLTGEMGEVSGSWVAIGSFFGGMLITGLIDKLIPDMENPHEVHSVEEVREVTGCAVPEEVDPVLRASRLQRMGLMTVLAVTAHNFPEGFATLISTLKDPSLGITIAMAIAIHNIPEGIAVSIPFYYATGSRSKAFMYSVISGLAEPAGAIVGYLLLSTILTDTVFGIVFAGIGGIMVFIALDQLLPTAREYGEHHYSIVGLVTGMALMAVSLQLFL